VFAGSVQTVLRCHTPFSRIRYETQFSFSDSFGPTAATVCSVRFTLRPPAAEATGALYGVGPPVRYVT
jgi:hypothetical protein